MPCQFQSNGNKGLLISGRIIPLKLTRAKLTHFLHLQNSLEKKNNVMKFTMGIISAHLVKTVKACNLHKGLPHYLFKSSFYRGVYWKGRSHLPIIARNVRITDFRCLPSHIFLYFFSTYSISFSGGKKSWDQQNYLVIRGFCYIRPLYNEVPLYFKVSTILFTFPEEYS